MSCENLIDGVRDGWANRIRTIHGSLAIEQNTFSLEQVTAVINGKHVLAPPKDIAEVKNAYKIYV